MEAALVSASTGVLKPLLSKLTNLLREEYAKLKGVRKQIKFLRDELSAMSATLQMLADAEELSPVMRDWRDKVRELAYDIEDCVDDFMARVDRDCDGPAGFTGLFRKFKKLKARRDIAGEIQELKARAVEASNRHKRYNFAETGCISSVCSSVDPRLPALYEDIDRLVGIDGPKRHIIEWLAVDSTELKVLAIAGCGGLGKTTLANQVYHTIRRSQFGYKSFVAVSRNPNLRKILRDIAQETEINSSNLRLNDDDDERQVINKLREHLQDKRYFVVIDDVWDANTWEIIKLALLDNNHGSRIITTTRSATVASRCSSQGGYVYEMKPLSFSDSQRLFFKRAFGSENSADYPHLKDIADEILRKCGGLPLAIITISSMLADQHTKAEWDRVLNAIGSRFARDPKAGSMASILSLSFFDLPHHLKTCFLYLSVFPEDYVIRKTHLINRWIAEGFIHEEQGHNVYETGESYFNELINRSLMIPINVEYGQAKACRVHDIILDYIICKAAEDNFVTSLDAIQHGYTSECKVRRLCVNNRYKNDITISAGLILSQIRSFSVFGYPVQTTSLAFTFLRVLDLRDCWGIKDHHLENIGMLFHLKYLRLGSSLTKIPEKIGELQYLQTLDVGHMAVKELPPAITKLQRLSHLYVNSETRFPDGVVGQMHNLEELSHYGVQSCEQGKSLQEFPKLTKLRTLKIVLDFDLPDGSKAISQAMGSHVRTLLSSCNLHNLFISQHHGTEYPLLLGSWHPSASCSIQKLCLKHCPIHKVPYSMGSLGNLRVLELMVICVRPEDIEILGGIPTLLFLKLDTFGGINGRITVHGGNGFRSLKFFSLKIIYCGTALEFEAGSMPKLGHVKLEFCVHKMECLNGASNFGIQHLSALCKVEVQILGEFAGTYNRNRDYDPTDDTHNDTIKCVTRAINAAVETLPNHPIIRFKTEHLPYCADFEHHLSLANQLYGGVFTEWLKLVQIEVAQT